MDVSDGKYCRVLRVDSLGWLSTAPWVAWLAMRGRVSFNHVEQVKLGIVTQFISKTIEQVH